MAKNEFSREEALKLFADDYFIASCNKETREELGLPDPLTFPPPSESEIELQRNPKIQPDPAQAKTETVPAEPVKNKAYATAK